MTIRTMTLGCAITACLALLAGCINTARYLSGGLMVGLRSLGPV